MRDRLGRAAQPGDHVPALHGRAVGDLDHDIDAAGAQALTHGIDHAGDGGQARDHAVGPRDDNCLAQLLGRIVASVVTSRPGSAPRSHPGRSR